MTKYKDIIINIFEEYIKLKVKIRDKKSLGKYKSRSKRSSKES